MNVIAAITAPIMPATAALFTPAAMAASVSAPVPQIGASSPVSFSRLVADGMTALEAQSAQVSQALSTFALSDEVPTHDLVLNLEQAKLTLQLALEIRNRLVDGYQELVRMPV